ncbi:hypothetical protein [uncultured Alteromonas sp.]|uniref:hypothetical protein n=1 Tax=uncultured Alteromonas sp. TaxID=179113 RepID=UPI0025E7DC2C|nr:hypothetical protein [uncultured Alteromonas sp.]
MRRQVILSALLFSTMTMLGCVSQPQSVKANLPLVNPSFTHHLSDTNAGIPEGKAKAIPELNISANKAIVIEGNSYVVSNSYISALGNQCYRLKRQGRSGSTEVRPVCNNQTYWLLYPALVFSNTL